jgi:hypothetical protein
MLERYEDLVELAKICIQQSRATKAKALAAELRQVAKECQRRAAALDGPTLAKTARSPAISCGELHRFHTGVNPMSDSL